jgi:hypothetical protein
MIRRVVYTCMFGYSEHFNDFHYETDPSIDFVCFTDNPNLASSFWRLQVLPPGPFDPHRASKRIKHLAHRYLEAYGECLYLDNTVRLKCPPLVLFEKLLNPCSRPWVCFAHPWRRCIYEEAREVVAAGYDDARVVEAQMRHYKNLGYPANHGLVIGGFSLRRHLDPKVVSLAEDWFKNTMKFSKRDQLSFNFVAWRQGFKFQLIDAEFTNNPYIEWPVINGSRLPRDFDDQRYLDIHTDVRCAKMNPREHYLLHGAAEGRAYK